MFVSNSIYFDCRKLNLAGEGSLFFRMWREHKPILVHMGMYAKPGEFTGEVFVGANATQKNIAYYQRLGKLQEWLSGYDDYGKSNDMVKTDCEIMLNGYARCKAKNRTLVQLFDEYVANHVLKKNTVHIYGSTKRKIEEFGDVDIRSVNRAWMLRFDKFLEGYIEGSPNCKTRRRESDNRMCLNSRSMHLTHVRAVCNYAYDECYITNTDYRKYKIRTEGTRHRCLTLDVLRQIRDLETPSKSQQEARDMFMLEFYLIGINNEDLFNAGNLVNGRLQYKRAKTNKLYDIAVPPEAMEIIERYKGKDHLLYYAEDEKSNIHAHITRLSLQLKKLGRIYPKAGVKRSERKYEGEAIFPELSFYWSRHTWSTLAAELDVPLDVISLSLGHSFGNEKTRIYVKFDNRKVDAAQRKVIDYLWSDKRDVKN